MVVAGSAAGADPGAYLAAVRQFADTMIERGTDRYGSEHSPLFAALLDLDTLSLPVTALPESYFARPGGQLRAEGYGIPPAPAGIRAGDRAPIGNNLEHDIMLLRTLYELTATTGEAKYAAHADAVLPFWLMRCQSPATGLMASGEHVSWDFLHERPYADVHEVYRRFPFYDKLYAIDAFRALRIADGMWLAQIGNRKAGDYSRHAGYSSFNPGAGAAYPRHAGFYIWAYANAYAQSRDPKYIERAEVLIESRTAIRPRSYSLLVQPGAFRPAASSAPALRALLWDAAELVPSRKEAWRQIVRELDARAAADPGSEAVDGSGSTRPQPVPPAPQPPARPAGFRRSETLSPLWNLAYGSGDLVGRALLNLTRYRQTGDAAFFHAATGVAEELLAEGLPRVTDDLWPRACGQAISLLVALSQDPASATAARPRYLTFARQTADMALPLFAKNGLFRASGSSGHYEAITGADDLLYSLLQLDGAVRGRGCRLPHIDVNW